MTTGHVPILVSMRFAHLTRESDVNNFTGFTSVEMFKTIYEHLLSRAEQMQYRRGYDQEHTSTSEHVVSITSNDPSNMDTEGQDLYQRQGRPRKLSLEQEFLLTAMRLRGNLPLYDLAFRFHVSESTASTIFTTWIRLMRLELSVLIVWPSRQKLRQTLPEGFVKFYPKTRCIIDCTNWMIQRPSSLELQAITWSDYYNHTCLKYMVAISPMGAITYVSPCYTGRASDKFIVRDSGFYDLLQPYDEVMADRGFKIREDLYIYQCSLTIPPSVRANAQMTPADCKKNIVFANLRIKVENVIGKLKMKYKILSGVLPLTCLQVADDIVRVCCALCNLTDIE